MHDLPQSLISGLADRYGFVREIGRGGMATVYLAKDHKHNRQVAVKVLRSDLSATIAVDRFLKEIQIAAGLTHPHIVALHDSGECEGMLYYVMPFVEGESLRAVLVRERCLELTAAVEKTREIARALEYAHRQGVVHRDVKPENVLLADGHAMVADFGIAKALHTAGDALTRTGFPLGTPGYMSPEQAAGSTALTEATDVYSLACVFYEMIVGELPGRFISPDDASRQRFVNAQRHHRERLDRLPGQVERALVRAMAIQPELRHGSPLELATALDPSQPSSRRYDAQQAQAIVKRAAELEATAPTSPDYSLGGIQEIANEVGIDARHVQAAAALADRPADGLVRGGPFGVHLGLSYERVFDGEVAPADYETLLEEIRLQLGEVGRINETLGRSLSWNSLSFQNSVEGGGRLIHVMIRPENGRTTLRITESPGNVLIAAGFAGFITTMGVSAFGIALLTGIPDIAVVAGTIGAVYAGLRGGLTAYMKRRDRRMKKLVDDLQRHIRNALR